jgi:two-component system LytT family response regulator
MLRVLIIDDERLARQHLRQLLAGRDDVEIAGEASSVSEALALIEKEKPNSLFLDIEMPKSNGFRLLLDLKMGGRNKSLPVVVVTAHAKHAVEAFEFEAVDYLLKPVTAARLDLALDRLRFKSLGSFPWQSTDRICFKTPERTVIAESSEIVALEADGDFTRIYIEGEHPLMICHNLSHYEKTLPSPPFIRLDRSLMINRWRVAKIEPIGHDHENLSLTGITTPFLLGRTAHLRLASALKAT